MTFVLVHGGDDVVDCKVIGQRGFKCLVRENGSVVVIRQNGFLGDIEFSFFLHLRPHIDFNLTRFNLFFGGTSVQGVEPDPTVIETGFDGFGVAPPLIMVLWVLFG